MAVSGARGKKQVRQLVAARGYLPPNIDDACLNGMGLKSADFCFTKALVDGMDPATAWLAAYNGRSSMIDKKLSTAEAGGLTTDWCFYCISEVRQATAETSQML